MSVFTPDIEGGNSLPLITDGSATTQPISAVSLPLPTGAATAALQTQPGVDIGDVTVNNATGAAAVNIQDGGNSITVDGTIAVSSVAGSVTVVQPTGTNLHVVSDTGSTTAVTGNVTVVQPTGTNLHVVVDSGTITTASNKATAATITRVATSTTAATVLTALVTRKKFVIRTETGTHTYVAYGSTATSTNYTYDLGPDATLEEDVWTGSVSVVRLSGTGSIQVTDLV